MEVLQKRMEVLQILFTEKNYIKSRRLPGN